MLEVVLIEIPLGKPELGYRHCAIDLAGFVQFALLAQAEIIDGIGHADPFPISESDFDDPSWRNID
jgi:hypothetical protein